MKALLRIAFSSPIVRGAIAVSLVVGTILNVINQGERILDGADIAWFHLALNYVVPYCVSSFSAAKNELTRSGNDGK